MSDSYSSMKQLTLRDRALEEIILMHFEINVKPLQPSLKLKEVQSDIKHEADKLISHLVLCWVIQLHPSIHPSIHFVLTAT